MFKFSEIEFDVREQSLEGHMATKSVNCGIDRRLDWCIEIRTIEKVFVCENYGFDTPESIKFEIDFPNRSRDWMSLENTEYNIGDNLSATYYISDHNVICEGTLKIGSFLSKIFRIHFRGCSKEGNIVEFQLPIDFKGIYVACNENDSIETVKSEISRHLDLGNLSPTEIVLDRDLSGIDSKIGNKLGGCWLLPTFLS